MNEAKETPEEKREKLRQEELKNNPTGNLNDSVTRSQTGGLADLVGSLGWKGTGIIILVLILGLIVASLLLK
ncbi:DUF6366 family protein [Priestia taiwanensis]|uniref:Phage capsid protein n=1 Tax=Priestia taiwanensis TaxID=1347902 RepID=A0A917ENK3_9BACI|nr:DUF6366 family protein [Priestia taiwanensis]MBM7362169.1 hypothetical protein [Priestia taiwanensis]GGE59929.1 hypothetical protein GCM10007140_07910 [Priestia taiwanensis]